MPSASELKTRISSDEFILPGRNLGNITPGKLESRGEARRPSTNHDASFKIVTQMSLLNSLPSPMKLTTELAIPVTIVGTRTLRKICIILADSQNKGTLVKTEQQMTPRLLRPAIAITLSLYTMPSIAADSSTSLEAEYNDKCRNKSLLEKIFLPEQANYVGSKYNYCSYLTSKQSSIAYRNVDSKYYVNKDLQRDDHFRDQSEEFFGTELDKTTKNSLNDFEIIAQPKFVNNRERSGEHSVDELGNSIIKPK